MSRRPSSPVLVGRRAELAAAVEDLECALAGTPTVILVGGEAGIGKTRLAVAVADQARSRGFRVADGACIPLAAGSLPYGPFSQALRVLTEDLDEAGLAQVVGRDAWLLGRISPYLAPGSAPATGRRTSPGRGGSSLLLEALAGLFGRLAAAGPLLLLIEDLQWADPESLDAVAYLARSMRRDRMGMLLTFRSGEPDGRSHLHEWLAEVERGASVDRIELGGLDRSETAELVGALLGSAPGSDLVDRLHGRSDGNPFYIEELLESGAGGDPATGLSPSLREVLEARIRSAPARAWTVLGPLAVGPRGLDDRLLAAVVQAPEQDLDAALHVALDHGLLVLEQDGTGDRYRLRHALIAEVVRDQLLAFDRRRLERRMAEALEERLAAGGAAAGDPPSWAEIAAHWDAADEKARALPAWFRAGEEAEGRFAFAAALDAFGRVLDDWDSLPDPVAAIGQERLEILDRAAWAAFLAGNSDADIRLRRLAVADADRTGRAEVAAMAWADLAFSLWSGDLPEEMERAFGVAEAMLPELPASTPVRARVLAVLGQMLMVSGRHRRSLPLCDEAIEIACRLGLPTIEANARNSRGGNLAYLGRCSEAIESLEAARSIALEMRDAEEIGRAYLNETEMLCVCGQDRRALDLVAEGVEASRRIGAPVSYGQALLLHAATAAYQVGDWEAARRYAAEGHIDLFGPSLELYYEAHVLELTVATGDWATAEQHLDRMAGSIGAYPVELQYTGPFATAETELRLWRGQPDAALRAVEAGLERLERADAALYRVRLLRLGLRAAADLAELARARRNPTGEQEAFEIARRLRDRVTPAIHEVEAMDGGARRLAEADLLAVSAEEARMRGRVDPAGWRAAAEAWDALERPYLRAYARWREAEARLREGDRAGATMALSDALATAERLGAAPMATELAAFARRSRLRPEEGGPPVRGRRPPEGEDGEPDPAAAFGLTPREVDVLGLLIEGRTDRQIAEALFISPHTVGIHVSRILGKLGVTSRTEAASVAYRLRAASGPRADGVRSAR